MATALFAGALVPLQAVSADQDEVQVTLELVGTVSLTDQCSDDPAGHTFTNVLPGHPYRTATGANVCQLRFSASSSEAALYVSQADGSGTAMGTELTATLSPSGANIGGIAMTSALNGWRVNTWGSIHRTTDGGQTWSTQYTVPAGYQCPEDVAAFSASTAVAVGCNGGIFRTTNTGANWTQITLPGLTSDIRGIAAGSGLVGWIAGRGGQLWKTADAGATWSEVTHAFGSGDFQDVDARSATHAVLAGNGGRIAYTTNGTDWTAANSGTSNYYTVAMSDTDSWMAIGDVHAVATTNSGTGYTDRTPPASTYALPYTLIALGPDQYVWGGQRGSLLTTANSGANWTSRSDHQSGTIHEFGRFGTTIIAQGAEGGTTLSSADSGVTWTKIAGERSYAGIAGEGTRTTIRVGDEGSIQSSTNLSTWADETSPTAARLWDVDNWDDTFVAVGDDGALVRSTNAGKDWQAIDPGVSVDLFGVAFGTEQAVWATGESGTVIHSDDAGKTWSTQATPASTQLTEVAAVSDTHAGAVDNRGDVWLTTDGSTWTRTYDGNYFWPTLSIDMLDEQTMMFAGGWERVHYTTNGGASWQIQSGWGGLTTVVVRYASNGAILVAGPWSANMAASHTSTPVGIEYTTTTHPLDMLARGQATFTVGTSNRMQRTRTGNEIGDYQKGVRDWDTGTSAFGMCLQQLGGATATAPWEVDAAGVSNLCEANVNDPWRPITTAPVSIAQTTGNGVEGTADFVFGLRTATNQPPGDYYASVYFEVIATDV